jgi:hypothetical protein
MSLYSELPIPENRRAWEQREAEQYRVRLAEDTFVVGQALFWKSNGRPVPLSCFRDAYVTIPAGQQEAETLYTRAAIADYRAARANISDEQRAEEAYERRAAFGPGVEVVDVLSGERYVS